MSLFNLSPRPEPPVSSATSIVSNARIPARLCVAHTTVPVIPQPRWRISTTEPTAGGSWILIINPVEDTFAMDTSVQPSPRRILALTNVTFR